MYFHLSRIQVLATYSEDKITAPHPLPIAWIHQ